MDFLTDYNILASLISLTALEIILGIDNVVFIALVIDHFPANVSKKIRFVGMSLALVFRIAMLLSIVWIIGLTKPLFSILEFDITGKSIMLMLGGLFLLYKATDGIHDELTGHKTQEYKSSRGGFIKTIIQIIIIDLVFSFDSVMTAVGITNHVIVIIIAMSIAMVAMLISAGFISNFMKKYPTIKMLALSFVMLIGVLLTAESLGFEVPKGYIYFGMSFSLGVEALNIGVRYRKKHQNIKHQGNTMQS